MTAPVHYYHILIRTHPGATRPRTTDPDKVTCQGCLDMLAGDVEAAIAPQPVSAVTKAPPGTPILAGTPVMVDGVRHVTVGDTAANDEGLAWLWVVRP